MHVSSQPEADAPELKPFEGNESVYLGLAIRNLRKARSMTLAQAGQACGLTGQAWSRFEVGKAPSIHYPDVKRRVAAAVGVTDKGLDELAVRLAEAEADAARVRAEHAAEAVQ